MNRKGLVACIIFAVIFLLIYFLRQSTAPSSPAVFHRNEGTVFGTLYHISYEYPDDLHEEIREELNKFDYSLSTFNKESVISKVNTNDSTVILDEWFLNVYNKAGEVSAQTEGAFDITVAPLVNAWGFGFKKSENVTPEMIDSIRLFVGKDKVRLENGRIVKNDPRLMLDASAIAKGYACDVVADLLRRRNITNFMVEIGGEVTAAGVNQKQVCWRIGINKPIEDQSGNPGEIQQIIGLCDAGMATSGNYRNFYYKDGKRYAHTIDPRTGYPVQHSLLSATVVGPDCMTADAFATAFMVLGLDKSLQIAENNPEIEAYFIYDNGDEHYGIRMTKGFERFLIEKK